MNTASINDGWSTSVLAVRLEMRAGTEAEAKNPCQERFWAYATHALSWGMGSPARISTHWSNWQGSLISCPLLPPPFLFLISSPTLSPPTHQPIALWSAHHAWSQDEQKTAISSASIVMEIWTSNMAALITTRIFKVYVILRKYRHTMTHTFNPP